MYFLTLSKAKLYEYNGETVENFIENCHNLTGMRYRIRRQIAMREQQNKRARLAAVTIQCWWRRKKNIEVTFQNPDGVSKLPRIFKKIKSPKIHPTPAEISQCESQTDLKCNSEIIQPNLLTNRYVVLFVQVVRFLIINFDF